MKMWEIVALPQGDEVLKNGRVADTEEAECILNTHERLVEALRACATQLDDERPTSRCMDNIVSDSAWKLLVQLEAGKGD